MQMDVFRPVIVLGAARSGTKMLRDAIAAHQAMVAIPYDINFVWKYSNYSIKHDSLTPDHVTPSSAGYVYKFFRRFSQDRPGVRVVEKTVGNTVRVDFVRKIFPSCQFVHLIRDGRDVSASARVQWEAPLNGRQLIEKVKYCPISALPNYAVDYASSYLLRKVLQKKHVSTWGVAFDDLGALLGRYTLLEVCGIQWSRCVELAKSALERVPAANKIEVRYERLVHNPLFEMERIMSFLGLEMSEEISLHVKQHITPEHKDKWKRQIRPEELRLLLVHISGTLERLGYLEGQGRKKDLVRTT
jgi:hypothetical protein